MFSTYVEMLLTPHKIKTLVHQGSHIQSLLRVHVYTNLCQRSLINA